MADVDKKARLAAARKKLKQLQKNKSPHNNDFSTNGSVTRSDSPATTVTTAAEDNSIKATITSTTSTNSSTTSLSASTIVSSTPSTNPTTKDASPIKHNDTSLSDSPQHNHHQHDVKTTTESSKVQTSYMNGDTDIEQSQDVSELKKGMNVLKLQNEELTHQMGKLQLSLELERKNHKERSWKDVTSLKEQLQVHIETVSILVAEKTELQSTCNQIQKISESRQSEIEELAGRLKASRQRVSDLERNGVTLNSSNQKLEKQTKELSKELDRLKMDVYKNNKVREELQQHNLELQGKLQQKIQEVAKSEDLLIEMKGKLEMSEVYIEQVKNGQDRPDSNVSKQIELILTEKTQLKTQLQMQEDSLKLMTREREAMATQYNDYVQQLSRQNNDLHQQMEAVVRERDEMQGRMEEVKEEVKQLKSKQEETSTDQLQVHEEKSRLLGDVEDLMAQLMTATNSLQRQKEDNTQLSNLLSEKEQQVLSLEMRVERMSGSEVDKERLFEEMHNDKAACSRATSQNEQLKRQNIELQDKFVSMSQRNMELMTKHQAEEHKNKSSQQRLRLQEDEIKVLKNTLGDKTRYLKELESALADLKSSPTSQTPSSSSSSSSVTSEQERMAELFRMKVPLIENLQKELTSAQDTVNALTNQNSELKEKLFIMEQTPPTPADVTAASPADKASSEHLREVELEKANLAERLKEALKVQQLLKEKIDSIQRDIAVQAPAMINGDVVNKVNFEALQHAMKQLEEKYSRVMRDKAEMADANERLEHIVLQLQGESDTIGEYVSLYQHQRHLMRQRVVEKDSLIEQLRSERKQLQTKLQQLQSLVLQLLNEGVMTSQAATDHLAGVVAASQAAVVAEKAPRRKMKRKKKKKMMMEKEDGEDEDGEKKEGKENDKGEDWPDYNEASEEEEYDEEEEEEEDDDEAADQSTSAKQLQAPLLATTSNQPPLTPPLSPSNKNIPRDNTVSKIMNLLSEISSSSSSSSASAELFKMNFFCTNCVGDILVV